MRLFYILYMKLCWNLLVFRFLSWNGITLLEKFTYNIPVQPKTSFLKLFLRLMISFKLWMDTHFHSINILQQTSSRKTSFIVLFPDIKTTETYTNLALYFLYVCHPLLLTFQICFYTAIVSAPGEQILFKSDRKLCIKERQ